MKFTNKIGLCVLFIVVIILLSQNILALGVTPARKLVDFEPGLTQTVEFSIVNSENKDMAVSISVSGELADSVELSDEYLEFASTEREKSIQYTFTLPQKMAPGTRKTEIVVREISSPKESSGTVLTARVAVAHQLRVQVPYEGKYAEIDLKIAETGRTDVVNFIIPVSSLGKENIDGARGKIDIYGSDNKKVITIWSDEQGVSPGEKAELTAAWSENVELGKYYAKAIVFYDKESTGEVERAFTVGEVDLEILEIRVNRDFKLGDIAKFNIFLENKWDEELEEVYAEMILYTLNDEEVVSSKGATESIEAFGKEDVVVYWDTVGVREGNYKTNLILYYDLNIKEEELDTKISSDSIEFSKFTGAVVGVGDTNQIVIALIFGLVLIGILWFIFKRKKT